LNKLTVLGICLCLNLGVSFTNHNHCQQLSNLAVLTVTQGLIAKGLYLLIY